MEPKKAEKVETIHCINAVMIPAKGSVNGINRTRSQCDFELLSQGVKVIFKEKTIFVPFSNLRSVEFE